MIKMPALAKASRIVRYFRLYRIGDNVKEGKAVTNRTTLVERELLP